MNYAKYVFKAIEEYVDEIFEIMFQNDDRLSDENYRRLAKVLDREIEWLGNPEARLLFWCELSEKLKEHLDPKNSVCPADE